MNIKEFALRRSKLAEHLLPSSMAILWSSLPVLRNGDCNYPYRQDSSFYYLSGYLHSESVCVITKDADKKIHSVLIIPDRDYAKEIWDGERYSTEEAERIFGFDQVIYAAEAEAYILKSVMRAKQLYFEYSQNMRRIEYIFSILRQNKLMPQIYDLGLLLKQLRMVKTMAEIQLMREACKISSAAHAAVIRSAKPGMNERDLEMIFRKSCMQYGVVEMAYQPIVAGGKNACTLHYTANNAAIADDALVLIDAAAEYQYYAADLTRTWPINGKFSAEQKIIYEIVLESQLAGIQKIKPGNSWESVQETVIKTLTLGLVEHKILSGSVEENIETKSYQQYYMHSFGHWLGLDTHDQGLYKVNFVPGMVLTIEPGLYCASNNALDPKWHNIGVRIEDNVLVTENGNDILSSSLPKTITDLEYLYAQTL